VAEFAPSWSGDVVLDRDRKARHAAAAMKAIWTLLFLACGAAAIGIGLVLVPGHLRGERFWLSLGAVLLSLLLAYVAIVLLPTLRGEQAEGVLRFQSTTGSAAYVLVTIGLAALSATGINFSWLAVLHILAFLMWVLIIGLGALGSQAMKRADELTK